MTLLIKELVDKYINFFKSKNHVEILENRYCQTMTVLFTTAGMHPCAVSFIREHPEGGRLTNYQKCIRNGDIDEVGDASHFDFFEMLVIGQ